MLPDTQEILQVQVLAGSQSKFKSSLDNLIRSCHKIKIKSRLEIQKSVVEHLPSLDEIDIHSVQCPAPQKRKKKITECKKIENYNYSSER